MATKAPEIIAFDMNGNLIEAKKLPNATAMVENAIREYIKHRYEWTPNNVIENLGKAQSFITGKSSQAYLSSSKRVASFSIDKKAVQKVFPTEIKVDLKKRVANISGERITSIMGIRAAGSLKLELHFKSGPHTKLNPWGVYIAREVELL